MAGTLVISNLSDGTNSTSSTDAIKGSAKAWVNFNGVTTATIRASYNVSSVTRNSTGNYTVNFTTALPDANYSVVSTAGRTASVLTHSSLTGTPSASAATVTSYIPGGTVSAVDSDYMNVAIFR